MLARPNNHGALLVLVACIAAFLMPVPRALAQTGACCIGTACSIRTFAACDTAGGDFLDGPCTGNPCAVGRCCITGSCFIFRDADCSGSWTLGGSCSPNPCPAPTGACCATPTCTTTTQAACAGTWVQGASCSTNSCGACCSLTTIQCVVVLQSQCNIALFAAGSSCSPNPCLGACCNLNTGQCQSTLATACPATATMFFDGEGSSCSPNPCVGACCTTSPVTCTITTSVGCAPIGQFQGRGMVCSPDPCVGVSGACCTTPAAACVRVLTGNCTNGAFLGNGSVCSPDPCPAQAGACCISGTCRIALAGTCNALGNGFGGAGSTCSPNPCLGACCDNSTLACTLSQPPGCDPLTSTLLAPGTSCSANPCTTQAIRCGIAVAALGGPTNGVVRYSPSILLVTRGASVEMLSLFNPDAPAPFSPPLRVLLGSVGGKIAATPGANFAFVILESGDVARVPFLSFPTAGLGVPTVISSPGTQDILADGDRVYIATRVEGQTLGDSSSAISVYETGPSGLPVRVGQVEPFLNGFLFDRLARIGNTLWAGMHGFHSTVYGIEGYNISIPSVPGRVVSSVNNTAPGVNTAISAIHPIGNRLFVTYRVPTAGLSEDRLRAVDVSALTTPVWHPEATPFNGFAPIVFCMSSPGGNLLRVALNGHVDTWDTTNPAALSRLGVYPPDLVSLSVRQTVSLANTDYWAATSAGVMVMNVSDPANLTVRSTLNNSPNVPFRVRQLGNITAVLDRRPGIVPPVLGLYDLTLPPAQQHRADFTLQFHPSDELEVANPGTGHVLACVATGPNIQIINITNPSAPSEISSITGVSVNLMSASGSRLYVLTNSSEFKVYDLSVPASPQLRSTTPFGGGAAEYTCMTSWDAGGTKAVALGTEPFGLWLINATTGAAPQVSAVYTPVTNFRVRALAKGANYLYVNSAVQVGTNAPTDTRLESIDVTNLANPVRRFVTSAGLGSGPPGVFDGLAYVAAPSGKFLVATRTNTFEPLDHSMRIYELPPGALTNEGVPFPIVNQFLPHAGGASAIAPGPGGASVLLASGSAGLYQIAMPAKWAPGFAIQPTDQQACYSGAASFTAIASASPTAITYEWRRTGGSPSGPISNGPTGWGSTISGATGPVLTITNIHPRDDDFHYLCVATNSCGSTSSGSALLSVCPGDFNCSGALTVADIFAFLTAWFAGNPSADFNGTGGVTVADIFDFLLAWFAGCPS